MDAYRSYLQSISQERRDPLARVLCGALACCTPFYRGAVRLRNRAYDLRRVRICDPGVPVVSVGNLTTGGTGKTPVVAWIVNRLRELGATPGILSRGYRSLDGAENDEKRLLDRLCPGVPHIQNRDRVAGAVAAVTEHGCSVLVLDDGFQHRRLKRQLDIVLIDAVNPWGYGRLLPRGLLREPPASLGRADLVLITRSDQVSTAELAATRTEIRRHTNAHVIRSRFAATGLINAEGVRRPLDVLSQQRAAAFCGIGNPEGFRRTLAGAVGRDGAGTEAIPLKIFPDHHHYTEADSRALAAFAASVHAECLVTTGKDLVKIPRTELSGVAVWGVEIELRLEDATRLMDCLESCVSAGDRKAA